MIVQCPYCATRYKVDEAKLAANARMKCSHCQQVFPAPSTKKRVAPAPTKPTLGNAANLKLPFDDSAAKDNPPKAAPPPALFDVRAEEGADDADEPDAAVAPPAAAAVAAPSPPPKPVDKPARAPKPTIDAVSDGNDDDDEDEVAFEISDNADRFTLGTEETPAATRRTPRAPATPRSGSSGARPSRTSKAPPPRTDSERGKFRAILVFQTITVVIYAVLFQAMLASPAMTDDLLQKIPLIGSFRNDKLMARKIALSDLTGGYQRIKDGKEVFVIRGRALNTASVPLQSVQIAGKLYDGDGKVVDTKTIFCGSVISTKVLKDLTPPELSMLQPPYPPKHFSIEPGDGKSFVVVFTEAPREAFEFSAQVVSAQRQS